MIDIIKYDATKKDEWDSFIKQSKNGTFLFYRNYMDYHADRFEDFSLLFYEGSRLIAVLPASKHGFQICSHGGLTYGGFVSGPKMTTSLMLQCFEAMAKFMTSNCINELLYKRIPYIYYQYPSDEDLYALFRNGAALVRRDISTCIYQPDSIEFSSRRLRNIKKAISAAVKVEKNNDFAGYFKLLADVLHERHQAVAVHTADEMLYLAAAYPDNIHLFCAYADNDMVAGVLVYETPMVAHTQYLANSVVGRNIGALDAIIDFLVKHQYKNKPFFDFGTSNEDNGRILNENLAVQKQEFGGRGVIHDFYQINFV